jgi:hypothetical protein
MSAWYVLSAMGFYPVTPGTGDYIIGTPQFPSVSIHLENGKIFTINGSNVSNDNYYVQSVTLNNAAYAKSYLSYADISKAGVLNFKMGSKPSTFGTTGFPSTAINDNLIVLNPVIEGANQSFKGTPAINIYSDQAGVTYYYTLDGTKPGINSIKFVQPFTIDSSITVKSIAVDAKGKSSFVTTAKYIKTPNDYTIALNTPFEQQYDAGGAAGLIDGIKGSKDWRKGNWQGYEKNDLDAVIDLQQKKSIHKFSINFLQDVNAWIILPKKIQAWASVDGKNWRLIYSTENSLSAEDKEVKIDAINATIAPVDARYIKVKATQFGKLPAWHEGAGGDSHLFVDEIAVE